MSESFSVGDVVIFTACSLKSGYPHLFEQEGTVVRADGFIWPFTVESGGTEYLCSACCIKKRQPPKTREPVSTWDDVIVWRPKAKERSHV